MAHAHRVEAALADLRRILRQVAWQVTSARLFGSAVHHPERCCDIDVLVECPGERIASITRELAGSGLGRLVRVQATDSYHSPVASEQTSEDLPLHLVLHPTEGPLTLRWQSSLRQATAFLID